MTEVRDRTFKGGEQVQTEGTTFVNCIFEQVQLRYDGGPHPSFQQCEFREVSWLFGGSALRTIQLLQALNTMDGSQQMIAELFTPGAFIAG